MSKFSVKKPLTVFVAVVIVLVLGVVSYTSMTPDLLPNINLPYVILVTPYPGASPEKVEAEVSKPLEQAMAKLDNIETVSSTSNASYSMVMMQFNDDANLDTVAVDILQQINTLSRSWDDMVQTPTIMKLNPNMLPVMVAAVDMEGLDITELSELVDGTLMNRLEGITGVASVSATGLLEEQVNITISPEKLEAINAKIRAALDKTLDETEADLREGLEELEDQLAEIESGKSALDGGKDTLLDSAGQYGPMLSQNQAELASAKTLLTAELEVMYAALPELRSYEAQLAQLNDGIKQLEAAERELAETLALLQQIQELERMEKEAAEGLVQLQTALDSLNQLDAGMAMFEAQFAQWREQLDEATAEMYIQGAMQTEEYQAIVAGYAAIDNALAEFGASRETLPALMAQTEAGLNELRGGLAQADAQLAANGMSRDDLAAAILQVQAGQEVVAQNLAEIDGMLGELGLSRSDVPTALSEISNARATLENSISSLEGTLAQLNAGSTTLNAAMAELETQKLSGMLTLSETTTQMMMGEMMLNQYITQIEDGLEQLGDAREDAYSQADVTEIITMSMVSQILAAQNFSMPAGYVNDGDTSYLVSVGDTINSVEELSGLLLFDLGMDDIDPIYLRDVADIQVVDNAGEIYANINGNNGVLLSFSKQSNFATATVSDNIADAFETLQLQYPGLTFTPLMDQGDYIYIVVQAVISNLLWGAVLAVIVLLLFLKSIKPSIITLASIPISILFAFTLMYFSGVNLNMFSLAGLAVAVGMLVDNSVVVIENIFRLRNKGVSAIQAAVSGAAQVGGAIAASTITTICVFLPIVFVDGLTRDLFTDFALTFAYALIASLIIALTVVPSMSARLLRNNEQKPSPYFDRFLARYSKMLKWVLNHKLPILAGSVAMLLLSGAFALMKGFSFMPDMDMGQLTVSFTMPEGTELADTAGESNIAVERILGIEGVETVGAMSGGSSILSFGSGGSGEESVTMYVLLEEKTRRSTKDIGDEILWLTEDLTAEVSVSASSGMDISMLSGSGVSINLYGDDLDLLQSTAKDIAAQLATVEGVAEASDGIDETSPEIRFVVDKNKAMEQGLTVAQVYMALSEALQTETTATSISYDGESYDVVVISGDEAGLTPSYIKNFTLTVTDREGETKDIRIGSIAEIMDTETMNSISRVDGLRYLGITATIKDGYNVSLVARDIEAKLADYALPSGFRIEFSGENETIMESMWELLKMLALGVLLVYLVMVAQFQSLKSPFIVMFTIPLAFTGGLLALLISGNDVSVISMIGFVMLVGIIVNNGIVLVDYINQLRAEGVETREAIIEAGATRMRPILMTTITTVFGLLTMAFGMGTGAEIMQPIAIVCIGGLLYATLLTLFVVPAIYELLNKNKKLEVIDDSELEMVEE